MNLRAAITIAMLFISPHVSSADDIDSKINFAQSRYETLNSLGISCDTELNIYGIEAQQRKPCATLLRNLEGKYFKETHTACEAIVKWATSNLINNNEATKQKMLQINRACNVSRYKYITKSIDKIKSLRDLE